MLLPLLIVLGASSSVWSLENGLARTPPMGWLTWERFRCVTDCKLYPNECISEALITRMADLMVNEGYLDAGYEYLGIDDCWLEMERDKNGKLVADKQRFPKGMKYISDYIHARGLKFGIYQDYGTKTCAGYPGVLGHEEDDVNLFAEWEVDYVKLDGCYVDPDQMDEGYPKFGKLLNATKRPILYSCSWPAYQEGTDKTPDYAAIAKNCNMWRNYHDIDDSLESLLNITDWFAENQDRLAHHAAPGAFNDPDMLIIGNFGLSEDQSRIQMAIWAILAAPLLMSADLATIKPEFKAILLNKKVIAVNQDPLGRQGLRIYFNSPYEIWSRDLADGSKAIAFISRRIDGVPYFRSFSYEDMKLEKGRDYLAENLFENAADILVKSDKPFATKINPLGVSFYKMKPVKKESSEESSEEKETKDQIEVEKIRVERIELGDVVEKTSTIETSETQFTDDEENSRRIPRFRSPFVTVT